MFHYLSLRTEPRSIRQLCAAEDRASIVRVWHDLDGDWQFIGPVEDPGQDGIKLSCFHCAVERDPTLRTLAKLPEGWMARREDVSDNWQIQLIPESDT